MKIIRNDFCPFEIVVKFILYTNQMPTHIPHDRWDRDWLIPFNAHHPHDFFARMLPRPIMTYRRWTVKYGCLWAFCRLTSGVSVIWQSLTTFYLLNFYFNRPHRYLFINFFLYLFNMLVTNLFYILYYLRLVFLIN